MSDVIEVTQLATPEQVARLRAAAEGLGDHGIAAVLAGAGVQFDRDVGGAPRLETVPRRQVALAIGVLEVTRRVDLRPGIAAYLGDLGNLGDDPVGRAAADLHEARNRGHREYERAQRAYDEALDRSVRPVDIDPAMTEAIAPPRYV